jgi:hypothetical protein
VLCWKDGGALGGPKRGNDQIKKERKRGENRRIERSKQAKRDDTERGLNSFSFLSVSRLSSRK